MEKKQIRTSKAPSPAGPYSQGIVCSGGAAGNLIFVAGTLPLDPITKKVVGSTMEEQTGQVFKNLDAILAEAGASLKNVVKVTAHLADIGHIGAFNTEYEKHVSDPRPVRTTVGSGMGPGILVEIDVIAVT
jgi:2-iminobutanoate/2-iminopropanoate deaminase